MEKNKIKILKQIIKDTFWMARRYANGRHTYAPYMLRDSYILLQKHFPELVPPHDITIEPPEMNGQKLKYGGFREDYLDDIN
jgi:hypothetical protein